MKSLVRELFQFNLLTLLTTIALIAVFSAQVTGDLGEPLDFKNDRALRAYLRQSGAQERDSIVSPRWYGDMIRARLARSR